MAHWGVLTVRAFRSRCKFLSCSFFLRRATKNATPEVKICVSPARNVGWVFFLASRCSAVAIFVHLAVTPRESTWYGHKTRLGGLVKFAFRLRRATTKNVLAGQNLRFAGAKHLVGLFSMRRAAQNASPEVKICASPARNAPADLGQIVFPAQGHAKRVSGGQNLRFACAGPQNRMIRMLRHESETWILQKLLRNKDAETWTRRHGSCRGAWDTKMLRHESEDVDLIEDPYYWMLRHESQDMDLVENPEIQRCWDMNPETWILQRIHIGGC